MKKALCVGIDSYKEKNVSDLHGCVRDALSVKDALERNGDGSLNFDVKCLCATSDSSYITRAMLKDAIVELFRNEAEIAVLYYSGHGAYDMSKGYLCTSEITRADEGLSLNDIMEIVSSSKARNKIIILDSCFCGSIADVPEMTKYTLLSEGTIVLSACGKDEYAVEERGGGVFTSLLVEAIYGGAMNLLGEVSPGSIYAYIDRSLGAWGQRPVFKANINNFVSLRKNTPPIPILELRKIVDIFENPYDDFPLDATYEKDKHESDDKTVNKDNEEVFSVLQKYSKLNLVIPVGEEHMYYAAIHNKSCKLTAQGQHYWKLVKEGHI